MSLTVRDLVADAALGLTTRAGEQALDRPISWVHTSELVDPAPFLEGGELLLTTGLALRAENCEALVRRLTEVGVAGLGFGVGLSHREIPAELVTAAECAGLPLLAVPRPTPFIAISKAVSRAIAAEEYASLRRTSRAQHELAQAAGTANGVAALVRKLSRLLDAWVLLLDAGGGRLLHSAPTAAASRLPQIEPEVKKVRSKRGLVAAGFACGDQEVSMQALGGRARGFLVVGRSGPFATTDHHVINSAASLLTLALEQVEALAAARRRLRAGFLTLMLHGESVHDVLAYLHAELPPEPFRVVVLAGARDRDELLSRLAADQPSAPVYLAEHGDTIVGLVGDDALDWLTGWPGVAIGVSEPCDIAGLAEGLRQAQQAARAAKRNDTVVRFGDLAGYGLLNLVPGADAQAFAEAVLAPLRGQDVLLESLRTWLANHGQWDPAASRLGVHRHTLRNRVRKVEELLGRSLDRPGVRAELWLALQVHGDAR
ncbi:PucR family transcriptional regulator [Saccharopolyspora phatthalungensis]|uniref:Purine catabolism regulator n=1 Tax=Saccharopolyspora phatthalungensis TaxID=664693 RepID=A0A840PZ33_9PSEU|nr:PucR family transcriptional regulator [Saccharopolyspora phatthalungensis]MBB5155542.1 purine catabolism regulator [Saccharopolyspora phatthalungensis]